MVAKVTSVVAVEGEYKVKESTRELSGFDGNALCLNYSVSYVDVYNCQNSSVVHFVHSVHIEILHFTVLLQF